MDYCNKVLPNVHMMMFDSMSLANVVKSSSSSSKVFIAGALKQIFIFCPAG